MKLITYYTLMSLCSIGGGTIAGLVVGSWGYWSIPIYFGLGGLIAFLFNDFINENYAMGYKECLAQRIILTAEGFKNEDNK